MTAATLVPRCSPPQEVAVGLLNDHLSHCVRDAARNYGTGADAALAEVAGSIRQVVRL